MMTRSNLRWLGLAAALALGAGEALAKTEGSLSGSVRDGEAKPLPGASVTVASPSLLGGTKTVVTDASGAYRFPALPPGTYEITIELMGFDKRVTPGIQIQINQPMSYDATLWPPGGPGVDVSLIVVEHESVVQPDKVQVSTALNNEFVDNVPVLGRAYQNLLLLAPGVTMGDSFFGGNPTSHGARSDANQYIFDSGNTGDTALGTFAQNFNQDAVEQIEVITAGYKAEFGRSDGAIANVLTKAGGNDLEGSFRVDFRDSAFDKHGSGKQEVQDQDFYKRYYSATLGGPFIKDRFWFFGSVYYQENGDVLVYEGKPYETQDAPSEFYDYFAKLSYQLADDHQLVFSWHHDPATIHNAYPDPYFPASYRNQQRQQSHVFLVKETAVLSPNLFLESLVNVMNGNELEVGPDEDAPASPDPWSGYDRALKIYYGQDPTRTRTNRDRTQAREDLSLYVDDAAGTHDLKFGVNYELETTFQENLQEDFYILENGVIVEKQFASTDPRFPVDESAHARVWSAYAQDSWSPREGMTLHLGVRADYQELEFNGHTGFPQVLEDPTFTFDDVRRTVDGVSDLGIAPRLGFSWDPGADGKGVVRGSASRFYSTLPGFAGTWDRGTYSVGFSCETDAQGNCIASAPPEPLYYYWLDRGIGMPYTDELTLGYEREVRSELALGVMAIYRKGHDLLQDIDPNTYFTDEDGDGIAETRRRRNESFQRPVFVVGNHDRSEYRALELTARKRLSDNWQLLASYTYSIAEGDGEWGATADGDDARLDGLEYSYLSYDQRHVVKVDGTYFLPLDFIVSASARYQTGTPYSVTVKQFDDGNGNGIPDPGEVPVGAPTTYYGKRNDARNDSYVNLDLRAEKDFVLKGVTLGVFGDVFNVLNNHAVVDTDAAMDTDGSGNIDTTETRRFGRRFQMGFRVSF